MVKVQQLQSDIEHEVEDLRHRVEAMEWQSPDDHGVDHGGGFETYPEWSQFFSVEYGNGDDDAGSDARLVINAPSVSIRTPREILIFEVIQGQNNWAWSSSAVDCHAGDTIKWCILKGLDILFFK